VDDALVAPLTFNQIMQRTSPITDAFTAQSNPIANAIAEHYHSMCLTDVHRQLKIAVRKHIQRMHVVVRIQSFFAWAADNGRIRVTPHQITLTLPDYDEPENPEEDYQVIIPVAALEVKATADPDVVILHLLLTAAAVNEIPPQHLPSTFRMNGSVRLNVSIPAALVTQ